MFSRDLPVTQPAEIRRLWQHVVWADGVLLEALESASPVPAECLREYAHILGADEIWLARIEGRAPRAPVWPAPEIGEVRGLTALVHGSYARYLAALDHQELERSASYTNSAGIAFETVVADILVHVVLHAQYHRGKINLLLRQAGLAPAPTDYIAFVRGAAAATNADPRRAPTGG
jgi:uncharacterized damage-inducible protein DinB